jgi:hypothetical protein
VSRLSGGWQVISHRALDTARSRYLDGQLVQPYHPFTQAAQTPLPAGAVEPVDVEVFPTGAAIEPGHRLRIAVQAFDVPHLLPSLTGALPTLTVIGIHTSAAFPSELTLPLVAPVPAATPAQPPATTRAASRTTFTVARPGRRHHATPVRITVTSSGHAATGRVQVLLDRRVVGVRALDDGHARVRIPARLVRHGAHRLSVRYLGTPQTAPSARTTRWRVR